MKIDWNSMNNIKDINLFDDLDRQPIFISSKYYEIVGWWIMPHVQKWYIPYTNINSPEHHIHLSDCSARIQDPHPLFGSI